MGVICGLNNTMFCEWEELGLTRQPEIKKANLNNTLKRENVGVFMKLLRRQNFPVSGDIYQKKQGTWQTTGALFYFIVALHDG